MFHGLCGRDEASIATSSDKCCLEGFRRDEDDARGTSPRLGLLAGVDVAVPAVQRQIATFHETLKASGLVIDKRLERADIKNVKSFPRTRPTTEADDALVEYRAARAGADPPRAPGGGFPGGYRGLTYLRMHGAPRVYFSSYDDVRLEEVAALLADSSSPTWCIFDNTASGAAAPNALELSRKPLPHGEGSEF